MNDRTKARLAWALCEAAPSHEKPPGDIACEEHWNMAGPHPGLSHEFRNECRLCGEAGSLHVALIGDDERVEIKKREP